MKPMQDLIKALLEIAKAIKGESGESEESGGKKEYFKMEHSPIGVCVFNNINNRTVDEIIDIEEFWNRVMINGEQIDTNGYPFTFVYDEVPSPIDFTNISVDQPYLYTNGFSNKNEPASNWIYFEIINHPGKYCCYFGG